MRRHIFASLLLLVTLTAFSQKNKSPEPAAPPAPVSAIAAKVGGMVRYPGFMEFHHDVKQDRIWLVIDRFDSEFLYVESLTAGIGSNDIGLDR
ncbi:MAG: peptidase, partial [Bacteroidota bacterium]